jgi:hypothetical protein
MPTVLIAELPGLTPDRRVVVRLDQSAPSAPRFELCEQHLANGIGWFDQRRLTLDSSQMAQLASLFGSMMRSAGGGSGSPSPEILSFTAPETPPMRHRPADRQAEAG